MIETSREGAVTVLRMDAEENRFNPPNLDSLEAALDEVDASEGEAAIVITGTGKFFSNGLDLEWMGGAPEGEPQRNVERVQALLARLMASPVAVIAAMNGHAFAAGAMLALACDERVMREDRGFFCLPEVDINIPFSPGMSALIRAKLPIRPPARRCSRAAATAAATRSQRGSRTRRWPRMRSSPAPSSAPPSSRARTGWS